MEKNERFYIAFGDAAALTIKNAMYDGLPKGKIVCFRDDFTQGPINFGFTTIELGKRKDYWHSLSEVMYNVSDIDQMMDYSIGELEQIPARANCYFWTGQSAYDKLALMWVSAYLDQKNAIIHNIDLLPTRDENEVIFNLAVLDPKDLAQSSQSFDMIHPLVINQWKSEWMDLAKNSDGYRILDGQGIKSVDSAYLENEILKYMPTEMTLAKDIIIEILTNEELPLSDITVEYLLRKMIEKNVLVFEGKLETMYDYQIKLT